MAATKTEARLNVRLSPEIKRTIEEAAAQMGQTVSDFAVSTLVHVARQVISQQNVTDLSERDRKLFVSMLDDESTRPNKALRAAARRYKKQVR